MFPDDPEIGWIPWVWVLYVGFVFLTPVLGELSGASIWIASGIGTAVFLPLYVAGYWLQGARKLVVATGIGLVGFAVAPFNPGASIFFAYSGYFAGLSFEQPRRSLGAVGAMTVLALLTGLLLAPTVYFLGPALLGVVVVGALGAGFARRSGALAELRMARAEVEALARIAERDRIASDLHDLLGHTLSVIVLKSELTQALATLDGQRAAHEAGEINTIARQALQEVRTAVRGYRVGSGAGLRQELEGVQSGLDAAGVTLEVIKGPETVAGRLDAAHEGVMALALREAATNIMRHAGASTCQVEFLDDDSGYGLEIRDDGRGLSGRPGHGLRGMKQRVASLGGTLSVKSDEVGTRLRLWFADAPAQENAA